ncbi:MAG: Hpt domain-containing protein [Bacilli bacterium]|nr:Hpt domain-containing protein [Bacilli bacterium]
MDTNILTNNGIDINTGLELLGDMEMYNETLNDFISESETRIPDIKKYFEEKDMPNYAILVHAMKSDSKYLGFQHLAELSYNHEMASKENNIEYVTANIEELLGEADRIITVVKEYLGL